MDFLCHRKKKKKWKWLMLYFGTWSGFVSYAIYFALLHVRQLLSVCAVILSTAPISWCCRSVFMAYGCWYHSLCFLLVCLDYQRGCHWAGEAIKGYLIPFHAKYIYIYTEEDIVRVNEGGLQKWEEWDIFLNKDRKKKCWGKKKLNSLTESLMLLDLSLRLP